MRKRWCVSSVVALGLLAGAAWGPVWGQETKNSKYEIQLLEKSWTPPAGVTPEVREGLKQRAAEVARLGGKNVHVLVQLKDIPGESEKAALWRDGLDLGDYVPGTAWIASVPAAKAEQIAARSEVRWMTLWDASRKLHPRLQQKEFSPWALDPSRPGWVMLFVQLHHDVGIEEGDRIADAVGGVLLPPIDGLHGATLWVPEEKIADVAKIEEVLWVAEGPQPLSPTNDGVRATMRVNPVNAAPYNLQGTGVRIFVFDGGTVRASHETFRVGAGPSRVTILDATPADDHPTHVAGTAAGDGAPSSPGGKGRGVAPLASLLSAGYEQFFGTALFWDNAGDIQADYALARNTHNADLGTNSIGSNTASNGFPCAIVGDYDVSGALIDGIIRGTNPSVTGSVIMTWANGNERTGATSASFIGRCGSNYATTAPPSCAKNPIHVGAVYSDGAAMTTFSSWGPCDDGRLKPIVSAPGCETGRVTGETFIFSSLNTSDTAYGDNTMCGTSMATPAVAGTVALLIQDWRARGFGGATARPLPGLVKALVVHSSRDLGQEGPDFIYGYGEVDAKNLIDTERAGTGTLGAAGPTVWGTSSITNGGIHSFNFTVAAGTGELKATLAWDDAPAAAFAASAPVNNLNLELIAPGGAIIHRPWILNAASPWLPATTGINNLDNQEQVLVKFPTPGVWTVRVRGTSVPTGPQTYGLVYTATQASWYTAGCTTATSGFEVNNDGWTLTGAARTAAPAAGHGSFSLRFGGAVSTTHQAIKDIALPARQARIEWTFWKHMTTQEAAFGHTYDFILAEVRNPVTNATLAVFDVVFDSWQPGQWMQQQKIDLTPWAGQNVRLAFIAANDSSLFTTFWVDDIQVINCPLADVWAKDLPADLGVEPDTGSPMWTSPDIWVRLANDASTVHQNPEFGQVNFIKAKLRNRGTVTAQNVPVKLYVARASVGLSWPTQWTFIGQVIVPSLGPGLDTTVTVPWSPTNVGHFCLVSRIDTAQDPMTVVETTDINFNTAQNNNITWRNVNIVNLTGPPPPPLSAPPGGLQSAGMAAKEPTTFNNRSDQNEFIFRNFSEKPRDLELFFRDRSKQLIGLPDFAERGEVAVAISPEFAEFLRAGGAEAQGFRQIDDLTYLIADAKAGFTMKQVAPGQEFTFNLIFQDRATSDQVQDVVTTYTFDAVQREVGQAEEGGVTYEIQAWAPRGFQVPVPTEPTPNEPIEPVKK